MPDEQEQLVSVGEMPVAVVGSGEDFRLIRLEGDMDAAIAEAHAEGYGKDYGDFYAGVFAVVNGHAIAKCQPGLNAMRVMVAAAFEYGRLVADRIEQRAGDGVAWLNSLHALEDPR